MLSVVDTIRTALSEQSESMSRAGLTARLSVDAVESRGTQDEEVTIHYLRGFEFVDVAIAIVMKDGVPMVTEDELRRWTLMSTADAIRRKQGRHRGRVE